ncbi:zinc-dependent alcohol dehydrogenase family protein [Plectonema cf. radiosum LEGE 06105]|uniref:Zinc-dependent alcohol dehydrogenase family protein n=1 Tax=Plectonema cf. radiosum LEGE 06105 TaxID=945769 RepID=A0A8J7F9M8_9CYAN|nr:zinc-dependent alcohol dehydrogenase family protein [Plectonema radiosum]MBE9212138.1 zinc-dependent alcohol dehydrogenase family protein [Plectonema cf. radiosum LEGE 06105]
MKAQVIEKFGKATEFKVVDLPIPKVIPNHVLIRVLATSVNPVDYKIRGGIIPDIAPNFPAVLHGDVAGVIEKVGEGVNSFQPGDEVYGCAGGIKGMGGALAEYILADAALIARKPKSLSMRETAALPLVSITAWSGLIERAKIRSGQTVLIYGGTGGVGHIAVQLAKSCGAKVYTTVSNLEKAAIVHQLGADEVINYRQQSVESFVNQHTNGKGFDIVFDTVGNDNLQNAFQAAALNGIVVSIVSLSTQDLTLLHAKGLSLHLVFMLIPMLHNIDRNHHGKILTQLAQLVERGQIRPLLDPKSFSFSEVAAAHDYAQSGQAIGKVTIEL